MRCKVKTSLTEYLYQTDFHLVCRKALHTCSQDTPRCHSHSDFYELVIVSGGSGVHRQERRMQRIAPGTVLLIKPGQFHEYVEYEHLEIYNLLFSENFTRYFMDDLMQLSGFQLIFRMEPPRTAKNRVADEGIRISDEHYPEILEQLEGMDALKESREPGTQTQLISDFLKVLLLLSRHCCWSGNTTHSLHFRQMFHLLEQLKRGLEEDWSLERMAHQVHMSVSSFRQEFRHMMRKPPNGYLLQLRLQKAAELLLAHREFSMVEVAHQCGFHDVNYLSRQFWKYYGIRPFQYRRNHLEARG